MKKPKWRKVNGEWRRGVLVVYFSVLYDDKWLALVDFPNTAVTIAKRKTPEAAMKAADAWWERTRKRMEGSD